MSEFDLTREQIDDALFSLDGLNKLTQTKIPAQWVITLKKHPDSALEILLYIKLVRGEGAYAIILDEQYLNVPAMIFMQQDIPSKTIVFLLDRLKHATADIVFRQMGLVKAQNLFK